MTAPVIHVQPTTQTVYEGQTCKLRVVAGGSSLSYQWQLSEDNGGSWSNVSGATSSTYTTEATVRSTHDQHQYRCNVTSGGDTTTSSAAIITVWNPTALSATYYWFDPTTGCYVERTGASATTASTDETAVGTLRDKSGTINGVAAADTNRPVYTADGLGGYPGMRFATDDYLSFSGLASFTNNKQYVYLFAAARADSSSVENIVWWFANNSTATRASLTFNTANVAGTLGANARRLDGDSLTRVSLASSAIDDEVVVIGAELLYGTSDGHLRKNGSRIASNTAFFADGATSATNSGSVFMGASAGPAGHLFGVIGHTVIVAQDTALSADDISHIERFLQSTVGHPVYDWNLNSRTTGLTAATKSTPVRIITPSGAAVTENGLDTHRYRHHNINAFQGNRWHCAWSSGAIGEDNVGQKVVWAYSDDWGATWSTPVEVIPAQSTWATTDNNWGINAHVCFPRKFTKIDGALYCVVAVDRFYSNGFEDGSGIMLAATKINDNGTVDSPFRATPTDYTALDGKTKLNYDSTLGPLILADADVFGAFGGSTPDRTAADYTGWVRDTNNIDYAELIGARISATESDSVVRVMRDFTNTLPIAFVQQSKDGGDTFGPVQSTNIVSGSGTSPAFVTHTRLVDGSIAVIGNNVSTRTELYLAILDGSTLKVSALRAIVTGISSTSVYAGNFKNGGAAYASLTQRGNYLFVTWSERKEDIWSARVLIPSLTDNSNYSDSIEIISPTLDDTRTEGTAANVTGTQSGTSGNVDILLSLDGGLTFPVTLASNTTLPYSWNPTFGHVTTTAVLRVRDTADTNVFGDSLEFAVEAAGGGGGGSGSYQNLMTLNVG